VHSDGTRRLRYAAMLPVPPLGLLGAPIAVVSVVVGLLGKLEPQHLIDVFGTAGLILIIFAESGLLVGFFLPGDSLLFFAGFLASNDKLDLAVILPGCFLAAVLGDQVGYMFGSRVGPRLFDRPDSRFFRKQNLERTNRYFEEHGPKTILLARFVPVVRTFAPIMAGVGAMRYRTFVAWNLLGGLIWSVGAITLGYFLGDVLPDKWFEPAVVGVVIVSTVPVIVEYRKQRREVRAMVAAEAGPGGLGAVVAGGTAASPSRIGEDPDVEPVVKP
jgi:membrane-associated protein